MPNHEDQERQFIYFPETVENPGKKRWTVPDVLASHMSDPILVNAADDDKTICLQKI